MLQILVRTQKDNNALNQLIVDCIFYNLNEKEALDYIESRFGKPLSPRAYYLRKKKIDILHKANRWIETYTKKGQVLTLHQLMHTAQKQFSDTNHQLYLEQTREKRNENLILKLKADLREEGMHILKLSDSTPIILEVEQMFNENERNKIFLRNHTKRSEDRIPPVE